MAVPSPSVQPTVITGGIYHFRYSGAIGVSGVAQNLNIDLTQIQLQLRTSANFTNQLQVEVKALDTGITDVSPAILATSDFHGSPIEYVTVQVTSDSVANECMILVTLPQSSIR